MSQNDQVTMDVVVDMINFSLLIKNIENGGANGNME